MGKSSVFLAISYTKRKKVENAIRKYLESKGLEVITGRDVASGGNLCDEIINLIQQCDFGVVVYNELRHNISYEWGLLDALKKKVVLLKDENIHIDLDEELSDKKGLVFTPFYGEDTENEIIEQLKKDKGLERALENNIEKRISGQKTKDTKKAAELLVKSDLVLSGISPEKIKELPNSKEIIKSLEKIRTLTADGHFIKGNVYSSEKKFDKAIEEYTYAINTDPNYVDAYNSRGSAYIKNKEFTKAIEDFNKAIKLNPEYVYAYNNRGIAYINVKEFDKAVEDCNKANELAPIESSVYLTRGYAYVKIKEFDKAIENYKDAIVLGEGVGAYMDLAEVYIINNNYGDSLTAAQKSLELSKEIKDIVASKLLIVLNLILQGKGEKEERDLIDYCNLNKGYELTFEFETLKDALKDSKYSDKTNKLIKLIEENAKSIS